jgi:hypothetical protein
MLLVCICEDANRNCVAQPKVSRLLLVTSAPFLSVLWMHSGDVGRSDIIGPTISVFVFLQCVLKLRQPVESVLERRLIATLVEQTHGPSFKHSVLVQ